MTMISYHDFWGRIVIQNWRSDLTDIVAKLVDRGHVIATLTSRPCVVGGGLASGRHDRAQTERRGGAPSGSDLCFWGRGVGTASSYMKERPVALVGVNLGVGHQRSSTRVWSDASKFKKYVRIAQGEVMHSRTTTTEGYY